MYTNIKYLNEIQRMQQLAGINEIRVTNPGEIYYIQDWVKPWREKDWDELRYELDEDTADAIYLLNEIQDDSNEDYITDQELNIWVKKDNMHADEDKDSVLQYLLYNNIIEDPESLNEIRITNPAVEQILIDFIDRNYKEFSRLGNSEVEEYDINDFEDLADDILNYLKSRPDNRFDYRGICVYWSDLYNTLSIENMNAEEDDDDERNEYYPDPDNI